MSDQAQPQDTDQPAQPAPTALVTAPPASAPARQPGPGASLPMAALLDPLAHGVTADELFGLARTLAASEIVPAALQGKPASVFAVIARGLELGITPMTAVCEIHVIKGRTQLSAHLQAARVLGSGKAAEFRIIESTPERAVLRVRRHEWPEARDVEWTFAEAKALGLDQTKPGSYGVSPWVSQPANMLRRRVTTRACREYFPDVIIAYDQGELDDVEVQAPTSSWSAPPAAAAAAPALAAAPAPTSAAPASAPVDRTLAPTVAADDFAAGAEAAEAAEAAEPTQQDRDRDVVLAVMADFNLAKDEGDLKKAIARCADLKRRAEAGDAEAAAHIADISAQYRARSAQFKSSAKKGGKP